MSLSVLSMPEPADPRHVAFLYNHLQKLISAAVTRASSDPVFCIHSILAVGVPYSFEKGITDRRDHRWIKMAATHLVALGFSVSPLPRLIPMELSRKLDALNPGQPLPVSDVFLTAQVPNPRTSIDWDCVVKTAKLAGGYLTISPFAHVEDAWLKAAVRAKAKIVMTISAHPEWPNLRRDSKKPFEVAACDFAGSDYIHAPAFFTEPDGAVKHYRIDTLLQRDYAEVVCRSPHVKHHLRRKLAAQM